MIRRFCDACHKEIESTANRMTFTSEFRPTDELDPVKVEVEVLVSINNTANYGEICKSCVIETVNKGVHGQRNCR